MKPTPLQKALFALRLGVFIVMFMWTIDKFINPDHAARVFAHFYLIKGLSVQFAYLVGAVQLVVVLGFMAGFQKKWTYGAIFVMHGISTLSSYAVYLDPWGPRNLLFFAAWPMLAATYALFTLRNEDTFLAIHKK